jgi:Rho termination factor-like protein
MKLADMMRIRPGGWTRDARDPRREEVAMPRGWSNKDERMYDHIKESSLERGMGEDRAEEIAARTVNKQRREEGRTPSRTTQGTGNPNRGYEARSREELYNIAKDKDIPGRSKMDKEELIEAIRGKGRGRK